MEFELGGGGAYSQLYANHIDLVLLEQSRKLTSERIKILVCALSVGVKLVWIEINGWGGEPVH